MTRRHRYLSIDVSLFLEILLCKFCATPSLQEEHSQDEQSIKFTSFSSHRDEYSRSPSSDPKYGRINIT